MTNRTANATTIADCAERLSRVRERFLDVDARNLDDMRVEIDRELRAIAVELFLLDEQGREAALDAFALSSRARKA